MMVHMHHPSKAQSMKPLCKLIGDPQSVDATVAIFAVRASAIALLSIASTFLSIALSTALRSSSSDR